MALLAELQLPRLHLFLAEQVDKMLLPVNSTGDQVVLSEWLVTLTKFTGAGFLTLLTIWSLFVLLAHSGYFYHNRP